MTLRSLFACKLLCEPSGSLLLLFLLVELT